MWNKRQTKHNTQTSKNEDNNFNPWTQVTHAKVVQRQHSNGTLLRADKAVKAVVQCANNALDVSNKFNRIKTGNP